MTELELPAGPDDATQSVILDDALALRRKLLFWRRVASLLLGLIGLVCLLLWQRSETSLDECGDALRSYATLAEQEHLENVPIELLSTVWHGLESPHARRLPGHYELIHANWAKSYTDTPIPLAVCGHTHWALAGSGRYVLSRTDKGLKVRWMSEDAVGEIVRASLRRN